MDFRGLSSRAVRQYRSSVRGTAWEKVASHISDSKERQLSRARVANAYRASRKIKVVSINLQRVFERSGAIRGQAHRCAQGLEIGGGERQVAIAIVAGPHDVIGRVDVSGGVAVGIVESEGMPQLMADRVGHEIGEGC